MCGQPISPRCYINRNSLLAKDETTPSEEMITRSMPLAVRSRLTTEPFSSRKFSCKVLCWNSKLKLHTSSSFNCLAEPKVIRGDIHDTVINCHSIRLSSGLRSWHVGGSCVELIWPYSNSGSRNGIQRIIIVAKKVKSTPRYHRMFSASRLERATTR